MLAIQPHNRADLEQTIFQLSSVVKDTSFIENELGVTKRNLSLKPSYFRIEPAVAQRDQAHQYQYTLEQPHAGPDAEFPDLFHLR